MLPAPTAPSEGYAGIRNLVDRTFALTTRSRSWLTSSGVAFHRTTPSCEEPDRSTRLRGPKVRWSFDLSGLASETEVPRSQNHSMFRGPSWETLYRVPLCSPEFRGTPGAASRDRKIPLPAPLPGWSGKNPKALPNPAGGDRTFGHLPLSSPLPAPRRPGPPSRSPSHHAHVIRVAKAKNSAFGLWITGISGKIAGTFSIRTKPVRFGCRSVLLPLIPLSA